MNYLEFKIDSQKKWVRYQRKNIKEWLIIGLIYPAVIAWSIGDVYFHPLNWQKSFSLGVIVTSCFWYLIMLTAAISDYKSDKRMLEFYEKNNIGNE